MRSSRRIGKVEAVISLLLFLVVVPFLWWLLLWAALNLPVSLLWWLLLVGMTLGAIRGFLIAIGQIASAWSEEDRPAAAPPAEPKPLERFAVEERQAALSYWEGHLKVSAFHEKEADRYKEHVVRFQNSCQDAEHLSSLVQAARRLILANEETLRRHASLELQAPPAARGHFSWCGGVFEWRVKWSKANHEALRLLSLGRDAGSPNARAGEYLGAVSAFQRGAEKESRELLKRTQITEDDCAPLGAAAKVASDAENWNPA